MKGKRIPDKDSLFRHSVFPASFRGKVFATNKLMYFSDQPDGLLIGSLAWQRYVPTDKYVHAYGCRLAYNRNEKKREEGKLNSKNRSIYCGAYQINAESIRALVTASGLGEIASVDLVHQVEEGEIAHATRRIQVNLGAGGNLEGTKTAIIDRLWNVCSGPITCVCEYDEGLSPHPASTLPTAPSGIYSDRRSHPTILWSVARFHVLSWLWRRFYR